MRPIYSTLKLYVNIVNMHGVLHAIMLNAYTY